MTYKMQLNQKLFQTLCAGALLLTSSYTLADGGANGGGGESRTLRVVGNTISKIPDAMLLIGMDKFPEGSFQKVSDLIHSNRILVRPSTKEVLDENGASVLAINRWIETKEKNDSPPDAPLVKKGLITYNPLIWVETPELDRFGVMAHEVFSLLGYENTNTYSYSNAILNGFTSKDGDLLKSYKGQGEITSQVQFAKDIILRRQEPQNPENSFFFYCPDRSNVMTCERMGLRSFSKKELLARVDTLETEFNLKNPNFQSRLSKASFWRNFGDTAAATEAGVGFAGLVTFALALKFAKGDITSKPATIGFKVFIGSAFAIIATSITAGIGEISQGDLSTDKAALDKLDAELSILKIQGITTDASVSQSVSLTTLKEQLSTILNALE